MTYEIPPKDTVTVDFRMIYLCSTIVLRQCQTTPSIYTLYICYKFFEEKNSFKLKVEKQLIRTVYEFNEQEFETF